MDAIKPKGYVISLNMKEESVAILSGFRTYNETNSIVYDMKAFLEYRYNNKSDKKLVLFSGNKSELIRDTKFNYLFTEISKEDAINKLYETNYLLIIKI